MKTTEDRVSEIISMINDKKLSLDNEKRLQIEIHDIFKENLCSIKREYTIPELGVIDFYDLEFQIGIEIKIKGSKRDIYFQCLRYCEYKTMKAMILLTNKTINLPSEQNGIKCYVYNLGQNWL